MVVERGGALVFAVDVPHGHKTGFYLDQRDNRARVRALASGREVLDCFCLHGRLRPQRAGRRRATRHRGRQLGAGARVAARRNAALNGLPAPECIEGDVFAVLRKLRDRRGAST